jgi:hypothetical protein
MENHDYEFMNENEINKLIAEEQTYRIEHGDTFPPDENLCKYCRNIDKRNHFCWDCDSGSRYVPITWPLFNLCLMFLSLSSGLKEAETNPVADKATILRQKGMIEALRFVMQPFGLNEDVRKFSDEIMNNEKGYHTIIEIEKAKMKYVFKQSKVTKGEGNYRETVGSMRCYKNVCTHCKYNYRFGTKFCWGCDLGTNFKNGIRSIQTIEKMLMFINTESGEALNNHERNEELTILRIGLAEGLKWIIKPYTTEESLIEKNGLEYTSKKDMNFTIQMEDAEYEELNNNKALDQASKGKPKARRVMEAKFHDELLEDEPPSPTIETINDNIPRYIKRLIIDGDEDSIIKSKVMAELMLLGLDFSDPSELDTEIASIRESLTIDK